MAFWNDTRIGVGAAPVLGFVLGALTLATSLQAADLDHPYYRYRRHAPPPPVAFLPTPPSCKIVPQPEMNLYNEVIRGGIQNVCISRGVYADSFWPYAPPYWRPNPHQGYAAGFW
jgi:hypothetical protein